MILYMEILKCTDGQIVNLLNEIEPRTSVPRLCREHGMSSASFYKWRAKYGGMDASMMSCLKALENENRRLKKMYAKERLKAEIIQKTLKKKWWSHLTDERWQATTRKNAR